MEREGGGDSMGPSWSGESISLSQADTQHAMIGGAGRRPHQPGSYLYHLQPNLPR